MQPNELTLEAQMFDAKINSMDKTCLLAPLSFFDACNVSTDEERLRRMMLLRTRALQLGISEQEYADRRDNYTSQFDADPSYCLKIARMALRRQAMQELGFTPMADVETRQAEYLIEPYLPLDAITIYPCCGGPARWPARCIILPRRTTPTSCFRRGWNLWVPTRKTSLSCSKWPTPRRRPCATPVWTRWPAAPDAVRRWWCSTQYKVTSKSTPT